MSEVSNDVGREKAGYIAGVDYAQNSVEFV